MEFIEEEKWDKLNYHKNFQLQFILFFICVVLLFVEMPNKN